MRPAHLWLIILSVSFVIQCRHNTPDRPVPALLNVPTAPGMTTGRQADWMDTMPADTCLFAAPVRVGRLTDDALAEASGLAASRQYPGCFWTLNDSGNAPELQLIGINGQIKGRVALPAATNRDWEDIAVGPGPVPGRSYLYVADIGDNFCRYAEKIIYRLPEPHLPAFPLAEPVTVNSVETIRLVMPNGPRNAEALLLDPLTLDLFVITKGERAAVYRAAWPQLPERPVTLELLGQLPVRQVTAGSVSVDGQHILLRTYEQVFYWTRRRGESIPDAFRRLPRRLHAGVQSQSEAIGWSATGSGFFTTSERKSAEAQPMHWYRRRL